MRFELALVDILVIALYFGAVFYIAWQSTRKKYHVHDSSAGYFLAGKNIGWFVVGASLFASNIGSEHLIGLAGTGFQSGVAVGQFEILASLILLILGWVFVPFYIKSGVYTMPEFLERRYSPGARQYLSWISILSYVLTKISVTVMAGGIVFEVIGIGFWTGAFVVVIATGIYTVMGGLRAVVYTELLQTFILIGGSVVVTVIGLSHIGGWGAMRAAVDSSYMSVWKPMSDPDFPWTGIIFGAPILGVWYWCTDQFIVQRVLSAKDVDNARRGSLFGGFLKVLPLFIFVIPGIIAYVLANDPNFALQVDNPDQALPALIGALLPAGLRGLVIAGLLAALMSSLSSVFNSCSTLITLDIYKKFFPDTSERKLVVVGQIATVVLVVFGLIWVKMMLKYEDSPLYVYLQSVQAYISPPIAAVFLFGIFWKRLNAKGAMSSLIIGFILGMAKLSVEFSKESLTGPLAAFANINFLHYAFFLFVICAVVLVLVSLLTKEPPAEKTKGLTFQTAEAVDSDPAWRRTDVMISVVLALCVIAVWIYFRG